MKLLKLESIFDNQNQDLISTVWVFSNGIGSFNACSIRIMVSEN